MPSSISAIGGRAHPQNMLTVAAADTPDYLRRYAHLKCHGTASHDVNEIKTALAENVPVRLLDGTYVIDATTQTSNGGVITLSSDKAVLEGSGRNTVLDFVAGQGLPDRYMLAIMGSSDYERKGCAIRNLSILGHDEQHHGIRLTGIDGALIENVYMDHDGSSVESNDEGIQFTPTAGALRGVVMNNVEVEGFDRGIEWAAGDAGCHDHYAYNLFVHDTVSVGLNFRTGGSIPPKRIHVIGARLIDNPTNAVNIDDGEWLTFVNSLFYGSGAANFSTTTTGLVAKYLRMRDCHSLNAAGSGYFLNGYGHVLEGCVAMNNGQGSDGAGTGQSNIARTGFRVAAVDSKFIRCFAGDDQASATQTNGFREPTAAASNVYEDCETDFNHVTAEWDLDGTGHIYRAAKRTFTSIDAAANADLVSTRTLASGDTETWEVVAVSGDSLVGLWKVVASISAGVISGVITEEIDPGSVTVTVADNGDSEPDTYDINCANGGGSAVSFAVRMLSNT